jgi:hypothetical protein
MRIDNFQHWFTIIARYHRELISLDGKTNSTV